MRDVVLLGVDDHRRLFPLDRQRKRQRQRDRQDALLRLHVLQQERSAHQALQDDLLLKLVGGDEVEHQRGRHQAREDHRQQLAVHFWRKYTRVTKTQDTRQR